ncbi:MAG: type II toxin-antitoxin system HicB family antitoxin [Paramuribaculum sp.]|nr:type II toxin-antitoxin system HicB family antitoxin [Paramuribaculum sp.]
MGHLKYKGYTGSVEFNEDDDCLFGKVQGLHGTLISYEGKTVEEIKEDFKGAIDDYLESCRERGIEPAKPYSGKFVVRMSSDLHCRVAEIAEATGTTINDFINNAITRELEHDCAY